MPQGIGVILILVTTGDLEDALAHERVERVLAGARAPLRDVGGDQGAEAKGGVGLGEPGQATIGGEAAAIKGRLQGQRRWRKKSSARWGRIRHCGSLLGLGSRHTYTIPDGSRAAF